MSDPWSGNGRGFGKKEAVEDSWENMLASSGDDEPGEVPLPGRGNQRPGETDSLSEEMARRLAIEKQQYEDSYEAACDLLGVENTTKKMGPAKEKTIASMAVKSSLGGPAAAAVFGGGYSLDMAKPRTATELTQFRKKLVEKVAHSSLTANAAFPAFLEELIHDLVEEMASLGDLKKLVGWTQTLYNKRSAPGATGTATGPSAKTKKPALKFGGSLKTGFDHGLKDVANEEDDYDFDGY